jgi:glucose-1-phosphate thymidylyltransferase
MKGILLAGGTGSRLFPVTFGLTKSLLPVYNKPMFYYPLATLMLMGIKDILIISSPEMLPLFEKHFRNGESLGIKLNYEYQISPKGIPEAFLIGEKFIEKDSVTLMLGDNLLHGSGLGRELSKFPINKGAAIALHQVSNPNDYGVASFDENGNIESIIEKPEKFLSSWAIPGIYSFDNSVIEKTKKLTPSTRNELEITDLLNSYLDLNQLKYTLLERGTTWLDMGSHDALLEAANYIRTVEDRQGLKIGDPHEVAIVNGWIKTGNLS